MSTAKKLVFLLLPTVPLLLAGGVALAGDTSNDRVFKGNQFIEYFKDDGNGKNYLYTETEFKDKWGRECTVVTGDSEKTIALDCEHASG